MRNVFPLVIGTLLLVPGCPSYGGNMRIIKDIPYAVREGVELRLTSLDIYAPEIGEDVPVLVFIHAGSREVSRAQSQLLAETLTAVGGRADVRHATYDNHMTLKRELGQPGDEQSAWVLAFLQQLSPTSEALRTTSRL